MTALNSSLDEDSAENFPFWQIGASTEPALLDRSGVRSYSDLSSASDEIAVHFPDGHGKTIGFLLLGASFGGIAAYLSCLRSRRSVPLLVQPNIHSELLKNLLEVYRPDWVLREADAPVQNGFAPAWEGHGVRLDHAVKQRRGPEPHPDLALLLSTSGSTGSEKLVRLSYSAIAANAGSIIDYLSLGPGDRTITTLPMAYSFGLSLLNSFLGAGASLVLTEESVMSRQFWSLAQDSGITSLSGVPSTFEMLRRVGLEKRGLDRLTTLTQAGGALRPEMIRYFDELARAQGWRMIVMYGQTEAAPRISYVPPERLSKKIGSIGIPIPRGSLAVDPASSELIYRGPNVMMGYAVNRDDLARGDECGGELRTGDLGRIDDDGFFYIMGRLKRFIKLSGARVNLDTVEAHLSEALATQLVCTGVDDRLCVWMLSDDPTSEEPIRELLRDLFGINPGMAGIVRIDAYPLTSSGKIKYSALVDRLSDGTRQ